MIRLMGRHGWIAQPRIPPFIVGTESARRLEQFDSVAYEILSVALAKPADDCECPCPRELSSTCLG